jgi:hypothetical protein
LDLLVIDDAYWALFPEVLSIKDVSKIIRKLPKTARLWVAKGIIPAHRVGKSWVIYKEVFYHRLENPNEPYPLPVEFLARFGEELGITDLEALLGKSNKAVYQWLHDGDVPGRKFGTSWLVYKGPFVQMLEQTSNQLPEVVAAAGAIDAAEGASQGDEDAPDSSGS